MNFKYRSDHLRLVSRNEGKIKSYDSCIDLRAWSHDRREQDCYLRDWIRSDMPICFIPTNNFIGFLRIMTCGSKRRAMPQCHPDCKSKIILDSLCASCQEIRECLKDDKKFDKYFEEEEYETSNWPCERCLEVFKSIKMFWRIIIEKIFKIKSLNCKDLDYVHHCQRKTVQSISQSWQKDMEKQSLYVKKLSSVVSTTIKKNEDLWGDIDKMSGILPRILNLNNNTSEEFDRQKIIKTRKYYANATDTTSLSRKKKYHSNLKPRKYCRNTSTKIRMADVACETCSLEKVNDEILSPQYNIDCLRHIFVKQGNKIEFLRNENKLLKLELDKFHKMCTWKSRVYTPGNDSITLIPKPFDGSSEDIGAKSPPDIDSEMMITIKDGVNESCRHISLIKILHKSKSPGNLYDRILAPNYAKEDPIYILTKVQHAFEKLVRREINITSKLHTSGSKSEITATVFKVNSSKSAPSCVT